MPGDKIAHSWAWLPVIGEWTRRPVAQLRKRDADRFGKHRDAHPSMAKELRVFGQLVESHELLDRNQTGLLEWPAS